MSFSKDDAVQKFWATPELIETLLLPFLDAGSTKHLAEAHGLTLQVLGKTLSWDKLIKRTFPVAGILLESEQLKAKFLAEIVSMTKHSNSAQMASNWPQMERVLLHGICERFPASGPLLSCHLPLVVVSCSCLETHQVSSQGFLLLEEVEAKLESVEQNVLRVVAEGKQDGHIYRYRLKEPLLSALSDRVLRQPDMVEELVVRGLVCNNHNSAEAWATLVEKSNAFSALAWGGEGIGDWGLRVGERIGADGWAAIRRVAERLSTVGETHIHVASDRKAMGEGRREDIEAIWQAASTWEVNSNEGYLDLFKTNEGRPGCWAPPWGAGHQLTWAGMDQIIAMSEQEWQYEMRSMGWSWME